MQSEPEDNRIDALIAKIAKCKPGYFCIATSIAPIENIHATNKRAESHSNQTPEMATLAAKSIHSQVFLEKTRTVASYRPMLADAHHTAASGGHASFSAAELHANGNSVGPEDGLPNDPMSIVPACQPWELDNNGVLAIVQIDQSPIARHVARSHLAKSTV